MLKRHLLGQEDDGLLPDYAPLAVLQTECSERVSGLLRRTLSRRMGAGACMDSCEGLTVLQLPLAAVGRLLWTPQSTDRHHRFSEHDVSWQPPVPMPVTGTSAAHLHVVDLVEYDPGHLSQKLRPPVCTGRHMRVRQVMLHPKHLLQRQPGRVTHH